MYTTKTLLRQIEVQDGNSVSGKELISFNAWPNPFAGRLNISFEECPNQSISIDIYDIEGKKISALYHGYALTSSMNFDLNYLTSAAYLLKVVIDEKTYSKIIAKD
jgi:hypothetical protein